MRSFRYVAPTSVAEAAEWLAMPGGKVVALAGGTDLLGILKDRVHAVYPEVVVGLKAITGLDYIRKESGGLAIGTLTRLSTVAAHPLIREGYPLLAQAAQAVGSPQLRAMGTVGGNLCQEPRCWYYRSPGNHFFCRRKGGGVCFALGGDNRFGSIFGATIGRLREEAGHKAEAVVQEGDEGHFVQGCVAVSTSDLATAVVALGAWIKTNVRLIPADDFFVGAAMGSTVLRPGEVVEELRLPPPLADSVQTYQKFRIRDAIDFAIVSAASLLRVEGDRVVEAGLVLGSVAPLPRRAKEVEAFLKNQPVTAELAQEAGALAVRDAKPRGGSNYKVQIAAELVRRAVLGCVPHKRKRWEEVRGG